MFKSIPVTITATITLTITIVSVTLLSLFPTEALAQWHQKSFQVMGTQAHVEFWLDNDNDKNIESVESKGGLDGTEQATKLIALVEQEMNRIDRLMSPYKQSSELSLINRQATDKTVTISKELFDLLTDAQDIAKLTDGAFDITYASIGYQYDYRQNIKPAAKTIEQSLNAINYHAIVLNESEQSVHFSTPKVKIDLGGIAKGHAVKQCLSILKAAGVEHALVSAGGDTGLVGDRRGRPWHVGIKHPRAADKTAVQLPLVNESISTSGDYERYFIEDGVRYHHIINPKTGDSARKVVSVSIIGQNSTYVDALSTAVFVKGLQEGLAFINQLPEYEAIIIDNQQTLHVSQGLQPD